MFRFYFQNGEFVPDSSGIIVDIIVSGIGALIGFLFAFYLYIISQNQVRRDRLHYVVGLLNSVIPFGKNQGRYCSEFKEKIQERPWETPLLKFEANRDLKRLASGIDQEGFYHAYLQNYIRSSKSYEEFRNIYAKIDFLDFTIDELKVFNEKAFNTIWARKKDYATTYSRVQMLIENVLNDDCYIDGGVREVIANRFKQILNDFYNNNPEGRENIRETFVFVIWQIRIFIVSYGFKNSDLTEILNNVHSAINQFRSIEFSAAKNVSDLNYFQRKIIETIDDLDLLTQSLREQYTGRSISGWNALNPFKL